MSPKSPYLSNEQHQLCKQIYAELFQEHEKSKTRDDDIQLKKYATYTDKIEKADGEFRVNLLIFVLNKLRSGPDGWQSMAYYLSQALARKKLPITAENAVQIFSTIFFNGEWERIHLFPIKYLLNQIKKQIPQPLPEKLLGCLKKSLEVFEQKVYLGNDDYKIFMSFKEAIGEVSNSQARFVGEDVFAKQANPIFEKMLPDEQTIWASILTLAMTASAGKPSEKYLKSMKSEIDKLGADKFKKIFYALVEIVLTNKEEQIKYTENYIYYTSTVLPICSVNQTSVKGLVWACSHFYDPQTLSKLSELAWHSYEKIPSVGARYQSIGNACLFALYRSKGLGGIAQLSRLRMRVKLNNVQTLIGKYLDESAQERGVDRQEIEDMAVDDFSLVDGKREWQFNNYSCCLQVTGVGKSDLLWFKPDGSLQKTVPTFIKENVQFSEKLKKIKAIQKNLNTMLTAQRDRLDQLLRSEKTVRVEHAQKYYWKHGLMSLLTRPLIWQFFDEKGENGVCALNLNGDWVNELGETVDVSGCLKVGLFHPVLVSQQSILNWRKLLIDNQIIQPMKQAFREIYLLTEAELNTRTYSNRFAGHILKQHQYMTLAKGRGWSGSLGGWWDGGKDSSVSLNLPEYNLTAKYWTEVLYDNDESMADSGVGMYVTTDQVRFERDRQTIELIDIPARIFSEVLRDVDLFVGVASVGNDPTWADNGGLPRYQTYWQSYSFGDLTEVAKTRKSILEMLLPRLKIGKVSHIDGNFLVVRGKIRTYKIHIGSSNILMLPNDQYLCIVPDRSKQDLTEKLFVPFEGDGGLSVVLSKAMLLMDDDKITDSTITSQIRCSL